MKIPSPQEIPKRWKWHYQALSHLRDRLNEEAFVKLRCWKDLNIVPGATQLFKEAGRLKWLRIWRRIG